MKLTINEKKIIVFALKYLNTYDVALKNKMCEETFKNYKKGINELKEKIERST